MVDILDAVPYRRESTGEVGVTLKIFNPEFGATESHLLPSEARALGERLLRRADQAEQLTDS